MCLCFFNHPMVKWCNDSCLATDEGKTEKVFRVSGMQFLIGTLKIISVVPSHVPNQLSSHGNASCETALLANTKIWYQTSLEDEASLKAFGKLICSRTSKAY